MIEAYKELDIRIQKWVFKQGWPNLREIQSKAVKPILACDRDVLISASTAAGKTEAFFLPACTAIADQEKGFGILYISPLKALINDQCRRLEELSEMLDMPVTPWHGDSPQSIKKKAKANPSGILLITPESLESLLVRESGWVKQSFSQLKYICIDEFHAFIGTERGQHLLSLLNRLEHLLGRFTSPITRVALSATLGDLKSVPQSLRPNKSFPCEIITNSKAQSTLKVQVKGFLEPLNLVKGDTRLPAEYQICQEIYQKCRGGSHLVFANSRRRTESISAQLADFSELDVVPNEFFPHHGSLAKELREGLESRLQKEALPTTAICTMTLELGIDIGKVNSVVQVTAPHSVSSLRQRLGRSGRRSSPAVLRMFIAEDELTSKSNMVDSLRLELVQSLAMIRLLIVSHWFEPADTKQMHLSTFFHQILAVIAQWGSIRVEQLYVLLCDQGPFRHVSTHQFKQLLSHMGSTVVVQQLNSGELVLGVEGERLVNTYTFYSVFKTPEEYRVVAGNKTLGTLPVDSLVLKDQNIVFGGRRWLVVDIDDRTKVIYVKATKGGKPPRFGGGSMSVHDVVRKEMFEIYTSGDYRIHVGSQSMDFVDRVGGLLFEEAVMCFKNEDLSRQSIIQKGNDCHVFSWMGDKIVSTITVMLVSKGYVASSFGGVIEVRNASKEDVQNSLIDLVNDEMPTVMELANIVPLSQRQVEKYDEYLPDELLSECYGLKVFNIEGAKQWVNDNLCGL